MTRLVSIAVREYLAYVRTFGFWLSLLLLPAGLASVVRRSLLELHRASSESRSLAHWQK